MLFVANTEVDERLYFDTESVTTLMPATMSKVERVEIILNTGLLCYSAVQEKSKEEFRFILVNYIKSPFSPGKEQVFYVSQTG